MKRTSKKANYVPEGFHTVTPYLLVDGAEKFIEFAKEAFDAKLIFISKTDDGKVMHATIQIGDSMVMLSDSMDGMPALSTMQFLYVEDADAVFEKALAAKGKSIRELRDEFYGDRAGAIKDPWNNTWWIATHQEDVSDAELKRRAKQAEKERQNTHAVEA
ncbi:MAG TPA: VOC family protein [Cyclobacteriaceae bacterium]|nr:VOC family protein [Cyclobacteriaceae bacterium]